MYLRRGHGFRSQSGKFFEKPSTKCEAIGLLTVFIAVFWTNVLERIYKISKKLQFVNIDLITTVELHQSLIHFVES